MTCWTPYSALSSQCPSRCILLGHTVGMEIKERKQAVRHSRSGSGIETFCQDLRFGLRQLRKGPLFAFIAILTLGIGIGANTAIFSFVNSVLLRPLPYPHPERLTMIYSTLGNSSRAPASMFELYQMRQTNPRVRSDRWNLGHESRPAGKRRCGTGQGRRGHVELSTAFFVAPRWGDSLGRKTILKMLRQPSSSLTNSGCGDSAGIPISLELRFLTVALPPS